MTFVLLIFVFPHSPTWIRKFYTSGMRRQMHFYFHRDLWNCPCQKQSPLCLQHFRTVFSATIWLTSIVQHKHRLRERMRALARVGIFHCHSAHSSQPAKSVWFRYQNGLESRKHGVRVWECCPFFINVDTKLFIVLSCHVALIMRFYWAVHFSAMSLETWGICLYNNSYDGSQVAKWLNMKLFNLIKRNYIK